MEKTKTNLSALVTIHIAVLFFGMAGVIGRGISAPAIVITFGRVFCSAITLFIIIQATRTPYKFTKKGDVWRFLLAGAIMALHWTSFMQSVQVASVAIGTITFATFPLFVSFLEPILFHERLTLKSVITAVLMLLGVFILAPLDSDSGNILTGIAWGMSSSLTYALLSLMNRSFSGRYAGRVVCFYEQSFASVLLLPLVLSISFTLDSKDMLLLIALGVLCTALAHTLFVSSLTKVKVQTAGIVSGMESVYGIILAMIFLGEPPTVREIIGGVIVLGVTVYTTLMGDK